MLLFVNDVVSMNVLKKGSENVGILMNSHPSVLSKYIFFPSIAEVMISEKLSGRPIPKSLEQQVMMGMLNMMILMMM